MIGPPLNKRVQRTRSRSPLTRHPLGQRHGALAKSVALGAGRRVLDRRRLFPCRRMTLTTGSFAGGRPEASKYLRDTFWPRHELSRARP